MKILFLAHRTPYPPNKGEKIRAYHILSSLAEGHDVSLVYWVDDVKDRGHEGVLRKICRGSVVPVVLNPIVAGLRGLAALYAGRSFTEGYFFSPEFQEKVNRLCRRERYDLIYLYSSPMAQYVKSVSDIPVVMDFVDVDSDKWGQFARLKGFPSSWFFFLERERLARYELAVARWARWSLFVSEAEADLFKAMGGAGDIVVLPNGVDSDLLRLPIGAERPQLSDPCAREGTRTARVVFTGSMNYFPNSDAILYFISQVLPLIRRYYPNVTVDVVGRFPPRAIRRLDGKQGIRVVGEVDDIRAYLLQADVSIAPLRITRGVPNKILEAMAMGIPVVATPQAVEGIQVTKDEEILIGDSAESFAFEVVRLLKDGTLRRRIAKKARARVVQLYSWENTAKRLEGLIGESISRVTREVV